MNKKLRFVLDFEVEIKEEIESLAPGTAQEKFLRCLLREFVNDDEAILDIYKLWLLGDLQGDVHYDAIESSLVTREEKQIIRSVIEKLPCEMKQHFFDVYHRNKDEFFEELETVFEQFSLLEFKGAAFTEI